MTTERLTALLKAAEDYGACFRIESNGYFCGGLYDEHIDAVKHEFVPLSSLLREVAGMREPETDSLARSQVARLNAIMERRKEEK
jgi:hypothetical protein